MCPLLKNLGCCNWGLPGGDGGKGPACHCRSCRGCRFSPRVERVPWGRRWPPAPVLLPGNPHGRRGLAGYSSWGQKRVGHDLATTQWQQSDTTRTQFSTQARCSWVLILYKFWIQVLYQMYNYQIFSLSLTCFFILLTVSFKKQIFFNFKVYFFYLQVMFLMVNLRTLWIPDYKLFLLCLLIQFL